MEVDVAIIGGGPGGSTLGTLLKKYKPDLEVGIFERETFPRDHVGESLLPSISSILNEMGCWDEVEAAGFPVKVGATYRWGRSKELWDFDFLSGTPCQDLPRPSKYEGQRLFTAFQVDRSIYDDILLRHAEASGCEVRQNAKVAHVDVENGQVKGLRLDSGELVTARYHVDASGASGIMRRALEIECEYPTNLKNVAVWEYWENAEWAVKIGVGGTRILIMSLDFGWLWFIPLGPARTSVGLVVPASLPKETGKKLEELYERAIQEEPLIASLLKNAKRDDRLKTTRDWSFLASRLAGENWLLVGESAGFADPILSAGLTLTHHGAREAAFTILEMDKDRISKEWLQAEYSNRQRHRIGTHIRFADYWYTANAQFKDLQAFSSDLAARSGLDLSPEKAWAWLAQGGFIGEEGVAGTGGFSLLFLKGSKEFLADFEYQSALENCNVFETNLAGAEMGDRAVYLNGGVQKECSYRRAGKVLPVSDAFEFALHVLSQRSRLADIIELLKAETARNENNSRVVHLIRRFPEALEAMVLDGWVTARYDASMPRYPIRQKGGFCSWNTDVSSRVV